MTDAEFRDRVVELLERIVARADGNSKREATAADVAAVTPLLRAIETSIGAVAFTVAELFAHASMPTESGAQLLLAIGMRTKQSLGLLFRQAVGVSVDGLCVTRVGVEHRAAIWTVVRRPKGELDEFKSPQTPPKSPRGA